MLRLLASIAIESAEINKANGWDMIVPTSWDDSYKIPALLALVHSEVSEATEAFRKDDRANFGDELADIILRTVGIAAGLGYDLDALVAWKLAANRKRGYKHGGKRI